MGFAGTPEEGKAPGGTWTGLAEGWATGIPRSHSQRTWLALRVALSLLGTGNHLPQRGDPGSSLGSATPWLRDLGLITFPLGLSFIVSGIGIMIVLSSGVRMISTHQITSHNSAGCWHPGGAKHVLIFTSILSSFSPVAHKISQNPEDPAWLWLPLQFPHL